ncbi:fimbrial protein [Morganella morganii]|uniref:fimbrial protein n=1 Tax=Morganella morganii TaxID=582 RepID=UPI001C44D301|nr:fimbrial protein [Morganella morganii]QXO72117.1 fimbrial protein [Morganella morganii]
MKIKLLAALAALGISGNALAVECTAIKPPNYQTERLNASSAPIELRADAPISPDIPIGQAISTSLSTDIDYICKGSSLTGNRPLVGVTGYPGYPGMYKTNIEGIGVKFTTSAPDGSAVGDLPRLNFPLSSEPDPETGGSSVGVIRGRFNATFYKLSNEINLTLNYPNNNLLFGAQQIGDNYLEQTSITTYYMDNIYIFSTPVCTVDKPLPVDFGTVNADNVRSGVAKPFQFGIVCKTDYNSYNVTASIKGNKITTDGKYIKVSDIKNNDDSLIIEITDDQKKPVMVDNSTRIDITNLKSGQKANFGWTANLKKQDGKPYPAQGKFTASAIITLDIK